MAVLDRFFDPRDTTIGNNTEQAVHGSITVTDDTGETLLDERYELDPADGDDDSIDYEDYLPDSGVYTVTIDLADDASLTGGDGHSQDVEITAADDEGILVVFGPANTDAPIAIAVIEDVSDVEEYADF